MSGGLGYVRSDTFVENPRHYSIFRSREAAEKKIRERIRYSSHYLERALEIGPPYSYRVEELKEELSVWENAEVIQVVD
jgi:hypothetical protein